MGCTAVFLRPLNLKSKANNTQRITQQKYRKNLGPRRHHWVVKPIPAAVYSWIPCSTSKYSASPHTPVSVDSSSTDLTNYGLKILKMKLYFLKSYFVADVYHVDRLETVVSVNLFLGELLLTGFLLLVTNHVLLIDHLFVVFWVTILLFHSPTFNHPLIF